MAETGYFLDECESWESADFPFKIFPLQEYLAGLPNELQRSSVYQLYFFEQGGGHDYVDFSCRKINDYSAHIVMPRQLHKLELGNQVKGEVILFGRDLFCHEHINVALRDYCFNVLSKIISIQLTADEFAEVNEMLQSIKELYRGKSKYRCEKIRLYFRILILRLTEISEQSVSVDFHHPEKELYIQFLQLLDQNFKSVRFVSDYAKLLSVSAKRLNALTKKYKEQTALEVIHERILLEARRLIMASDLNYKEIAYELGFDSPSAFSKFVQTKTGVSPSELKQQMTQIYKPLP
ncbi:MAG: helix-turn-helix domain-containing protein [Marinifilaceae bacterium]